MIGHSMIAVMRRASRAAQAARLSSGTGVPFAVRLDRATEIGEYSSPAPFSDRATRVRQQIRFCRAVDGTRLAYALSGEGAPLVKTGNWLTHLEHDWRTPLWQPFLARLSESRRLVRYDPRGNGLSDWDVEDLSLDANVADLEAVVDAAGLERFDLLGISQGGCVAVAYAARHPERVRRIVLYGAYARGMLLRDRAELQREEVETLRRLIRIGWGSGMAAYRQVFSSLFMPTASQAQQQAFSELQLVSASAHNAERILATFCCMDVRELAPRVAAPTLIMHVRGDAAVPYSEGRLLATMIPNAEFVPIEGENHVLIPDDPAFEQIGDEIERFLAAGAEPTAQSARLPSDLTGREREVLELIARGYDNGSIAAQLHVSSKTVRNHVTHILAKLDVTHRSAAIVLAREAGMGRGGIAH
jgi:pimeloyl-ACP methyl ester carboxylesterase/DNA-binding CsgD family transcriptional regulator